jgi:cytochrome P450
LRGDHTRQAGFNAELLERIGTRMNKPVLFQEGAEHHEQRKQTARFFTPRAVSENYRALMDTLTDTIVKRLIAAGSADLSALSMALAVRVAGEVVGLTDSRLPGMSRRLDAFFQEEYTPGKLSPHSVGRALKAQSRVAAFFYLDVQPAIAARRKEPREDVISHLIGRGYTDSEILTECVTYGAAGMATTREFICVATWHLLDRPALRARYLVAGETERHAILNELLRLEPVVGHLYRRTTIDVSVPAPGGAVTIPAGELVNIHVNAVNADPAVAGENSLAICPGRALGDPKAGAAVMSFGDGHHRCPGAFIAIQETDVLLRKLMAIPSLRVEQAPNLTWSDLTTGYELRDFIVAID